MECTCADSEVLLELSGHTKAGMKVPVSWDPDEAVCIVEGTFFSPLFLSVFIFFFILHSSGGEKKAYSKYIRISEQTENTCVV